MVPRRFEDQSVHVGGNRDAEVQVREIAVALGLECAAQRIAWQVGSFDLRIHLQLEAEKGPLSPLAPHMLKQFLGPATGRVAVRSPKVEEAVRGVDQLHLYDGGNLDPGSGVEMPHEEVQCALEHAGGVRYDRC